MNEEPNSQEPWEIQQLQEERMLEPDRDNPKGITVLQLQRLQALLHPKSADRFVVRFDSPEWDVNAGRASVWKGTVISLHEVKEGISFAAEQIREPRPHPIIVTCFTIRKDGSITLISDAMLAREENGYRLVGKHETHENSRQRPEVLECARFILNELLTRGVRENKDPEFIGRFLPEPSELILKA